MLCWRDSASRISGKRNQRGIMKATAPLGILPCLGLAVFALALGACAKQQGGPTSPQRMFGLVSGPIPPAQPFVVAARRPVSDVYPAVGITPPTRTDKVLTEPERAKLEADLKRYASPDAKPSATATKRKKKPVPLS